MAIQKTCPQIDIVKLVQSRLIGPDPYNLYCWNLCWEEGMARIEIKAGERRRIIRRFSSSVVATYQFSAEPLDSNDKISGRVEVRGSRWLFSKPVETQALQQQNSVKKGMWDTFYSVYVAPDVDVKIKLQKSGIGTLWIYITIAIMILIFAVGLLIVTTG
jgi:hypothetical protein